MYLETLIILIIALRVGIRYFLEHRKRTKSDAEWERRFPRAAFRYCGKTLLFFDLSHGNQIEYLDPNGYCYLWYPGNYIILVGRWRIDESNIYFKYGSNTFNPVTTIVGGNWEKCHVVLWSISMVDEMTGDIFELTERIPFVMKPFPRMNSLNEI